MTERTPWQTATSKWHKELSFKPIITSCRELDAALSNGIPIGVITEFCGPPGSGKTQICKQLCVNVQLPSDLNGIDGEAVFIDTNHGYNPYRFRDIAKAQSAYCQNIYKKKLSNSSPSTLVDKFMNGIHVHFVRDYMQLLMLIYYLPIVLTENSRIRLVVIDSFSFLFRQMKYDKGDLNRTRILYEALTNLQKLADQFNCAVVLTNELTTRMVDSNNTASYLVPSMGDSYCHRVGQLVTLAQYDGRSDIFYANIDKALYTPEIVVKFRITVDGIRSV